MSTRAVTPDASAASDREPNEIATPDSLDEALETGFLPDDPHYRLTGEFKPAEPKDASAAAAKKEKDESAKAGASAASEEEADTAAASAAADTAEDGKGPAHSKTAKTSESRWAKVTRENRELKEKLARAEAGRTAEPSRDSRQASQPAAETTVKSIPRPSIDELDPKTGKPKFSTYAEYEAAKDEWLQKETLRQFQEQSAKTTREQQQAHAEQVVRQEWGKRVETAASKYSDFQDVALNPDLPIKLGTPVDVFILDSTAGTDVLYYLGQNPAELDRINKLSPLAQVRELTKLEIKLSGPASEKKSSSAKTVTQAPPPAHQVSGNGTVAKDAVEQAVEDGDTETYMRAQNAKELARLKRK